MPTPPSAAPRLAAVAAASAASVIALASCALLPFAPDRAATAPVLGGFGSVGMAITTRDPAAQALFESGMAQMYAFDEIAAGRAFKAALARDTTCAMCAWGVAKAAGPNINDSGRDDLTEARRHLAWASANVSPSAPRERALIDALAERYGPEPGSAKITLPEAPMCGAAGTTANPRAVVYAARMRALADANPADPDLLSLYAEAAMLATADDWWDKKTGLPGGEMGAVTDRLERALAAHPQHTGLNHYLIHAADSSPHPERALAAADRLGALAPDSPHLLHMPAHIYVHTGQYREAARVNEEAVLAQGRLQAALAAQGFAPSVDWDRHDRHFLWFAALTAGRGEVALAQARSLASASRGKSVNAELFRSLPILTLVRLERWPEVAAEPAASGDAGLAAPIADYAHGVALVRSGRVAEARARLAAVKLALDAPALKDKTVMGDDPARKVLEIFAARLDAEIALAEGRPGDIGTRLGPAAELEAELHADEPPILGSQSRVALGALLVRAGRWAEAEKAYRAELVAQPGSGWALAGLAQALAGAGRDDEARRVGADAGRAWAEADAAVRRVAMR